MPIVLKTVVAAVSAATVFVQKTKVVGPVKKIAMVPCAVVTGCVTGTSVSSVGIAKTTAVTATRDAVTVFVIGMRMSVGIVRGTAPSAIFTCAISMISIS